MRDSVRATLEAEIGTITGGAAYQRLRPRIDSQFADSWTNTGRPSGRQAAARAEHDAAESAATEAAIRLAALEQGFSDLQAARARLKVLDRDLADTTDAERRKVLVGQTDVARSAAQLRDTRLAEQGRLADQVSFARKGGQGGDVELASVEEGRFVDGSWVPRRVLNGDERLRIVPSNNFGMTCIKLLPTQ